MTHQSEEGCRITVARRAQRHSEAVAWKSAAVVWAGYLIFMVGLLALALRGL